MIISQGRYRSGGSTSNSSGVNNSRTGSTIEKVFYEDGILDGCVGERNTTFKAELKMINRPMRNGFIMPSFEPTEVYREEVGEEVIKCLDETNPGTLKREVKIVVERNVTVTLDGTDTETKTLSSYIIVKHSGEGKFLDIEGYIKYEKTGTFNKGEYKIYSIDQAE